MHEIYLDNAATTQVIPQVADAVSECIKNDFGNPSSLHRLGLRAEKRIKEARETIGKYINVKPDEIIFTSGGTEGNNLCILGYAREMRRKGSHFITTAIEHPSVLNTFGYLESQGNEVTYLPVNSKGKISIDDLKNAVRPDTVLISIMHVNNETGSVMPIEEIGDFLSRLPDKPAFHVDATQSFGKIPLDPARWGVDMMTFSGHKVHALKGIGAIYKRKNVRIRPLQWGGGQESGIRSGTENIAGIVSMNAAVNWIAGSYPDNGYLYRLKRLLISGLKEAFSDIVFNGDVSDASAPHILNVSFPGLRGEVILHSLEDKGVYISTGSACSGRSKKISHVLKAMGINTRAAESSVRLSISYTTAEEDIRNFIPIMKQTYKELAPFAR